jgi:hypothetical protein
MLAAVIRTQPYGDDVDVEFVRVDQRTCLARANRGDGAVLETTATAKSGIPHDLEHFIVELELGYEDGFWGRVARGAEFSSMRVRTMKPRRRPRADNRRLAKGYDGWAEHLVFSVVSVYGQAKTRGWVPPARLPDSPELGRLLDPRRRPPVQATVDRVSLWRASVALDNAQREWAALADRRVPGARMAAVPREASPVTKAAADR